MSGINNIAVSPDGTVLACELSGTGDVRVISLVTGRELLHLDDARLSVWDRSPDADAARSRCNFSPNGRWFAALCESNQVRLFDTRTWEEAPLHGVAQAFETVSAFRFSPDNRLLAVSGSNTHLWDLSTGRSCAKIAMTTPVAFSPDGKLLAGVTPSNNLRMAELESRRTWELQGHEGKITGLLFLPSGCALTAFNYQNELPLRGGTSLLRATTWDPTSGHLLYTFKPPFRSEDLNHTGMPRLVAHGEGQDWKILDVHTGDRVCSFPQSSWPVRVSPDERTIATWETQGRVENPVWEWLKEHLRLGSAVEERTESLTIWDVVSGQTLGRLERVTSDCLFSRDNQVLVTRTADMKSIGVWDLPLRKPIGTIAGWSVLPALAVLFIMQIRSRRLQKLGSSGS
jgi:WD40 repeat protein